MLARIYITGIGTGGQAEENVCHPPHSSESLTMYTHTQNAYFQSVLCAICITYELHINTITPSYHPPNHMITLPCKQFLQLQMYAKYT